VFLMCVYINCLACLVYAGNNYSKAVIQQQQKPFYGALSGTTQVSRYQKKHSPIDTYHDHRPSFVGFLHLLRPIASSLFNLRAWQSFCTTSVHVLTMIIPRWCWWCWQDQWYRVLLVHVMNAALSTRWPLHQQSDLMWTVSPLEMAATIGSHHCHLLLLLVPTDNTHFIFTPCPEKNGTNNVLGITLANTNI